MKKKIWFKVICFIMLAIFPALTLFAGCADKDANIDGNDGLNGEQLTSANLYGTKVLYRPDDYDYDIGSGGSSGDGSRTNDYYGKYAWQIVDYLYRIYEISNTDLIKGNDNNGTPANNPDFDLNNIPYLYDSMRYQVNTEALVTQRITINADGTKTIEDLTKNNSIYYVVGADISLAWNWGAPYDLKINNTNTNTYLTDSEQTIAYYKDNTESDYYDYILINNNIYNGYDILNNSNSFVDESYSINWYSNQLTFGNYLMLYYLGTSSASETEDEEYSDFVKALEYAIYCYAIDIEPSQVSVTFAQDGTPNFKIGTYASVDEALEQAKENFKILGSFVGLSTRQIEKIKQWVLDNIIGQNVVSNNDYFYRYSNATEIVTINSDGTKTYSYDFGNYNSVNELGRNYEETVNNIIDNVCSEVSIGKNDDGSDVTIDDRFPASEIMEYAGVANNVYGDDSFAVPGEENSSEKIRPYEYQSIAFMVKDPTNVDTLSIAVKYDAGLDGTQEGVYGEEYIEMIIDVNYYNHITDELQVLKSQKIKVYDGPFNSSDLYLTSTGGKDEFITDSTSPKDHFSGVTFDDLGIKNLSSFNVDIGGGILKTDVGKAGYGKDLLITETPLVLTGTSNVRKYYEIVEPGSSELDEEVIADGYTYLSGRFNSDMFGGAEGCDYLEVTFKVIKEIGDLGSNYRFYAGAYLGGIGTLLSE